MASTKGLLTCLTLLDDLRTELDDDATVRENIATFCDMVEVDVVVKVLNTKLAA